MVFLYVYLLLSLPYLIDKLTHLILIIMKKKNDWEDKHSDPLYYQKKRLKERLILGIPIFILAMIVAIYKNWDKLVEYFKELFLQF